jgi:nucleoside-diphosphate-sugar epimerase
MKILITGGAGLIGRWTVDHLVRAGHDVVAIIREPSRTDTDLRRASREVIGDISDVNLVRREMADGIEGVIHLAAIPAPPGRTAVELLTANSLTTMTILEAAGDAGVDNVVIASSLSALGMAWSDEFMHPLYVPIDEEHPLRPTEGYALSKENDEAAARMAHRRWGMTVIALRFPFTATRAMIDDRIEAARMGADNTETVLAKELWAYLDVRDAARACELALLAADAGTVSGALVLNVMADDVILPQPLPELLAKWHPDAPLHGQLGKGAYRVAKASETIGFTPQYLLPRAI